MNVVYAYVPIFSYFDPARPCQMPAVNFGHKNMKCPQLVPGFWVYQNRISSGIFHSDFVVGACGGNKYHWTLDRARLVSIRVRKPIFYA
jgi:hypothetical protein